MNCTKCNKEIPNDFKFCPYCATPINKTQNEQAQKAIKYYEDGKYDLAIAEAKSLLQKEENNDDALIVLAKCYENGHGVDKDFQKALHYYSKSNTYEATVAYNRVIKFWTEANAKMLVYPAKSCIIVKKYADAQIYAHTANVLDGNNGDALYCLGVCAEHGYTTALKIEYEPDPERALQYYKLAAELNSPDALHTLGLAYKNGVGVEVNLDLAFKYLKAAVDNGSKKAVNDYEELEENLDRYQAKEKSAQLGKLAQKYLDEKNPKAYGTAFQAVDLDRDNLQAHEVLMWCHFNGLGTACDKETAFSFGVTLAENGLASAQNFVGWCYQVAVGTRKSNRYAKHYYEMAAKQGYLTSQTYLAMLVLYNEDVQDYAKALKWGKIAGERGNASAQVVVAHCYYFGYSVPKNYAEAFKWHKKAAENGHKEAMYYLGIMYKDGKGVAKSKTDAKYWLEKAHKNGHASALEQLKLL